ncbi:MAG: radical SAM protein [Pseudomonadota bacterium]
MSLRIALCYANRPAVGHTNLGFALVRSLLEAESDCLVTEHFLTRERTPGRLLRQQDLVVASVPFEGDYQNLVKLLVDGEVEPLARRRTLGPLVLVGGMAPTLNPEPLAEIADLLAIGDAEGLLPELAQQLFPLLRSGADRTALLEAASEIAGVYLPARYGFEFGEDGSVESIQDLWGARVPALVPRRWIKTLESGPGPLVSDEEIFAGCAVVEATRGCLWGCRFCAAGFVQRPYRERALEPLWEDVQQALALRPRVGLVGADLGDHSSLRELAARIHQAGATLTPSALRATAVDEELARALAWSGKKTATLAPEAGSERLRYSINKQIDDAALLLAVDRLAAAGIESIRLYFLLGLPGEQDSDVEAIADLALACRQHLLEGARQHGRVGRLTLSVTPFVPKPATPFQWEPFIDDRILRRRARLLRKRLDRVDNLELRIDSANQAREQAILSRGDRRLGPLLVQAVSSGRDLLEILLEHPEVTAQTLGGFAEDSILPWQQVDHGVGRAFLLRERRRALQGTITPPCDLATCSACELRCARTQEPEPRR